MWATTAVLNLRKFFGQRRRVRQIGIVFRGDNELDAVAHEPAPLSRTCGSAHLLGSPKLTRIPRRIDAWASAVCSRNTRGAFASMAIIVAPDIGVPSYAMSLSFISRNGGALESRTGGDSPVRRMWRAALLKGRPHMAAKRDARLSANLAIEDVSPSAAGISVPGPLES
jgi:hypothetical protein